jgi:hypothetical protein
VAGILNIGKSHILEKPRKNATGGNREKKPGSGYFTALCRCLLKTYICIQCLTGTGLVEKIIEMFSKSLNQILKGLERFAVIDTR